MDINEQTVRDWGPVSSMFIAAPCNDLTNLRNFIGGVFVPEPDKRPGLDGPSGMILRHCLQVLKWALYYNPQMMFILENVVFDDREEDWEEVCNATGVRPVVIMGSDVSYTRRLRAWWTNIKLPESYAELTKDQSRGDPNDCMDQGRKLVTFEMDGRQQVRPIGASWTGDPDEPTARTGRPIEVIEEDKPGMQQLRPGEAEKLHNLRAGCTDAPGVKAIDRLTAIGGGWDMNVIKMILQHSKLKVSEVHMNGAMEAYPGEAGLQEYMRYSAENTTQACPAPIVGGIPVHDEEEMKTVEQMMQVNIGRRGQGVKKLSEIEIERHNALVEDVLSDEEYAALEDSSLDDDSIKTSDEELDEGKSDEDIDKDSGSSSGSEWEGGTEPSSEEIKSDADEDQRDTDEELTMVAEVLVDSHEWQENSAAEWKQAQGEMAAAMSRISKITQELGGSIVETSGTKPVTLLMMDGGCYWPIVGKNALHLCVNFRSCKPEPVMTGSGLI